MIIQDQFGTVQNLQKALISQTSKWSGTIFGCFLHQTGSSGQAGWALANSEFGSSVNAHQITSRQPCVQIQQICSKIIVSAALYCLVLIYLLQKYVIKSRNSTSKHLIFFSDADLLGNSCDRRYISFCLWTNAIKCLLSSCAYQKCGIHQHFHDASGNDINKVCLSIHLQVKGMF